MTPGTTIVAVKRSLRDRLKARHGLSGVLVNYGDPGERARREQIYIGEVRTPEHEPVAIRAGTRKRDETYELSVHVQCASKVQPEANEVRLVELIHEVESELAEDPTVGSVPGVLFAVVSELSFRTLETPDGPVSAAVVIVTVRARLK
jgi:hypothetical protein